MVRYAEMDERINAGWEPYEAALKANNKKYQMFQYPGTQHGFHNDTTPRYDEKSAKLAWQRTIDFFIARGLLGTDAEGRVITREAGQSDSAFRLRVLARNLLPAIERYYIGVALLVKNGPHTLSAGELETLCWLTAQRLSLLHELNAPEFFDRSLFRGFIQKLRERRVIWADENGKLVFDTQLNAVAQHARVILSREIRHGILKLTPEKQAELTRSTDEGSAQG